MPITVANAAEGANDSAGVDTTAVLNGSDAGLKANDSQIIPASGDFTVETWVQDARATSSNHFNILAQTNIGSANIGPEQFVIQTFDKQVRVYVGNQFLDTGIVLAQNVWYHIAATVARSGSNITLSVYINGAYAAVKTFATTNTGLSTYTPGNDFWVGSNPVQPSSEFWNGKIDQVKVWADDLTEAQVAQSMHAYSSTGVTGAPSLVGHFDFNEGNNTDGKIYNRADAAKDLVITTASNLTWADVAEVVSGGNIDSYRNIVYKFPRSYLNAVGGWAAPSNLTAAEVLTVGGGGGGGENVGNGGSGGSISYHSGFAIPAGSTFSVKVGQGGRPGVYVDDTMYGSTKTTWTTDAASTLNSSVVSTQRDGGDGQSTSLSVGARALTAPGGLGGMTYWTNDTCGAGTQHTAANTAAGAAGTGGTASGVGATGGQGILSAATGVGSTSVNDYSISGSSYKFGAGGAGADGRDSPVSVAGGADGGGSTSLGTNITTGGNAPRGGNGAANSGSGGSGGNTYCSPGGAGGSGVVYVRSSAASISDVTAPGSAVRNLSAVISAPAGTYVATVLSEKGTITAGALNGATNVTAANVPSSWSGYLALRGTPAQLSAAIAAATITMPSTTGTAKLKLELNPVVTPPSGTFFNQANGHYYQYVNNSLTYTAAKTAANAVNYLGLNGYLINITSAAEQDFQYANNTTANIWIGAREVTTNGNWRWFDGPESNTAVLTGNVGGSPAKASIAGQYQNFNATEPNNNSGSSAGDDCAVGNFNSSNQWDDVPCSGSAGGGYIIEFGGRTTDAGVDEATLTTTLQSVNVNFTELNFDYSNTKYENLKKLNADGSDATLAGTTISATNSTGKAVGDRVLFKAVTVRNGVTVDAVVTTRRIVSATIKNYEASTNAGGASSNFQVDVDIAAANGYAEFQFDFYATDANIIANCNAAVACTGSAKVILENINVSIIDIDYYQWNEITGLDSYTVSNPTNLKECLISSLNSSTTCTSRVAANSLTFPADLRFQGPSGINSTLPQDMAIANYGSIESFKVKFGRDRSGSPNYYGIAFKALSWGSATPATVGPVGQSYTIAYNSNSATSGSVPSSHTGVVGSNFTTATNSGTLVRTGYTFTGWNTSADGTGTTYAVSSSILMPKDGLTLYAIWTPSQYTLTYNPNGGAGAPANELRNAGSVANLSSTVPTRSGYSFAGWTANADGTGANTAAGASYTMPGASSTIYAKWTLVTTSISYNGNNSTGGSAPATANGAAGSSSTTAAVGTLERDGYTFAGWNTAANGSGTDFAAGSAITFPASGSTVLYAQWTAVLYTLSYNANGGVNANPAAANQSANYNATLTLAGSGFNPTRTGYTFAGWNLRADGTGTNYNAGANNFSMPAANTVLYAKWTAISYTLTYDANTGDVPSLPAAETGKNVGQSVTLSSTVPTKTGFRFTGWNTNSAGTGNDYAAGSVFTMPAASTTLYAKWVASNIKVTYDANGGTGTPPAEQGAPGSSVNLSSSVPSKEGFTFLGWCADLNSCPAPLQPNGSYTIPNTDTTLFAKWAAISYTFTYNTNGGTAGAGAPTTITGLNVGGLVTIYVVDVNNAAPSRAGYSFTGWNAAANGTSTNYAGGSTHTMGAGNYTIYAQWIGNPFTLTYNSNGGSAISPSSEVRRADSISNITSSAPTRSGYTFSSWNTAANGSGTTYASSASLTMPASNLTLYAQWTAINSGVSYNANGGSGAPAGANYNFGSTVTVSGTVPTQTGYTFTGWNTAQNGTGDPYSGGDTFSMPSAAVVLYAQWSATSYVVSYDANGGSNAPISSNRAFGATVTVAAGTPTRNGYDFQGWNTAQAGTGTARLAGATFTMPASNVTHFAQWSLATFTVYYNANGGSGSITPQPGRFNNNITVTNTTPSRPGYTFNGWNTAPDGSGVDYSGGGSLTLPASNVTLYAKWTPITYALSYAANGGTGAPVAETGKTTGETFSLSASTPTRTNYWFSGWNTQADGNGTTYSSSANFTMGASNVTLYAVWVLNTHTVSYNANGGTGAPAAQTVGGGSSVTIPANPVGLSRPGYDFSNWHTTPSGTGGSSYSAGNSLTPSGNVVLYAQWTAKTITVTYDINTGTGNIPGQQTATYDGQPIQLAGSGGFTKSSSTFLTWNTASDGSGTSYAAEDPNFRVPSSDITLYAIWSATFFAVEFEPNGGTGEPADQFAAPTQTVVIPNTAPALPDHEFVAWSDVSTGNTYSAGSTITMPTSNVTLVANYVRRASVGNGGAITTPPTTEVLTYPKKLNLTVYFKGDRSYLTSATKTALKKLAATAKKYGYATNITIYGRVKETADKSYDARLSKARATNVAAYLKKLGVSGAFKVIAAGISPENKPISRRVDMSLYWNKR